MIYCRFFFMKRIFMIIAFLIFQLCLITLSPGKGFCIEYYVDFEGGNDGNNGQTTLDAFKHCPGDANGIGISAETVLRPGDTVFFKGGVEYSGKIEIKWSGSEGSPITYQGNNSSGTWGTDKAGINLQKIYSNAFNANSKADYINILNFDLFNGKIETNSPDQGYIRNYRGGEYWNIGDCIIRHTDSWETLCPVGSGGSVVAKQTGILLYSGANFNRIENCEIFGIGRTAIWVHNSNNVVISKNDFGGKNRGSSAGYFSVAIRITDNTNELNCFGQSLS